MAANNDWTREGLAWAAGLSACLADGVIEIRSEVA